MSKNYKRFDFVININETNESVLTKAIADSVFSGKPYKLVRMVATVEYEANPTNEQEIK